MNEEVFQPEKGIFEWYDEVPPMLHIVFAKSFLFIKRIIGRDHSASVLFSITSKYRYILSSSPIFEILDNRRRRQQILMSDTFSKETLHSKWITCLKYFFNFHNLQKLLQSQHFYYIKLWYFSPGFTQNGLHALFQIQFSCHREHAKNLDNRRQTA